MPETTYGSGHANLDRDHALLYDILDRLKRADLAASEVPMLAHQFAAYLDAHFEHEELLMDRHAYSQAREHKQAHREFRADVARIISECTAPGAPFDQLARCIEQWLEGHTGNTDRHFADFLRTVNVEPVGGDHGTYTSS